MQIVTRGVLSEMEDTAPSLTEVVKQVAEQQQSQASEIQKSRQSLSQIQAELYELETELKSVQLETKDIERKIVQEEDFIDKIMHQCEILKTQDHSICAENINLKLEVETQREALEFTVARNNGYRERIADRMKGFSERESELPFMIELNEKQAMVQLLKKQKEEMILNLHNPGSTAIKQLQEEILNESEQIKAILECINAKKQIYEEELERHAVLRKEIEVEKKRYNAILKRLHSQLNKAELNRRQYQWNIAELEKKASTSSIQKGKEGGANWRKKSKSWFLYLLTVITKV
ncbi:coiled-coil domain-containing protein 122 isoform X2 [Engystomops pustulosus]|uniref:coiled-coil domain-containing protein 122 isoform X2 n=1 Tax=Engystomops pustulosus TaxID=76066 RepID=UPI003AFB2725